MSPDILSLVFISVMLYYYCVTEMNWIEFKGRLFDFGCFGMNQVHAWQPGFDRNNLTRWLKRGYLIRLRQGLYTFPEYRDKPDMALYFAGRIYNPSYISLHTALSSYGLIPEGVVQITSVTSLKTARFSNEFGNYEYHSVRNDLMFGYEPRPMAGGRVAAYATREKALLDLLYLHPFYNTEDEMANLRLDNATLHADINRETLEAYAVRFRSRVLERRVRLMRNAYEL
jgi:predicted transcriptional regulator of viral defense system